VVGTKVILSGFKIEWKKQTELYTISNAFRRPAIKEKKEVR
jgi:hypothetical protein